MAEQIPTQICGIDVVQVGEEYWANGKSFDALIKLAGENDNFGGVIYYDRKPIFYKPELGTMGEIYKPLKLSEGAELLNKQLMVGMCEWLADRSSPGVLVSFLDVPIAVDLCELQDKTDDDIVELVQNRIVEALKERLSVKILEKLRG